jgi:hypothetical protein
MVRAVLVTKVSSFPFIMNERHRTIAARSKKGYNQCLLFDREMARTIPTNYAKVDRPANLIIIYSYGDFRAGTPVVRSDDTTVSHIQISRTRCVPANKVVAFFSNPFSNLETTRTRLDRDLFHYRSLFSTRNQR